MCVCGGGAAPNSSPLIGTHQEAKARLSSPPRFWEAHVSWAPSNGGPSLILNKEATDGRSSFPGVQYLQVPWTRPILLLLSCFSLAYPVGKEKQGPLLRPTPSLPRSLPPPSSRLAGLSGNTALVAAFQSPGRPAAL